MARARNIKPSTFTNDVLAECPALARLLFIGLWTIADREGRLEDRPKKIRAEVLPYDDCDPDSLLQALADKGFIARYQHGGNQYIQIVNFKKHQNPHQKEQASTIPAPDMPDASNNQGDDKPGLFPLTDSLIPHTETSNEVSGAREAAPETPPVVSRETENKKRGNRLQAEIPDLQIPEAWGQWAYDELSLTESEINFEWEKFRDYWQSIAGQKGCKLDWPATWRNWCRKKFEDKKRKEELNGLYRKK
jgi:hypothetical protein